jgi:hypothetical protein
MGVVAAPVSKVVFRLLAHLGQQQELQARKVAVAVAVAGVAEAVAVVLA